MRDTLAEITPYVLAEQQDWFEDELGFLRLLLRPGQLVVDIGANHGVYSLSLARVVGPHGRVWAFEPASATAALLAESVQLNAMGNLQIDRSAVSQHSGTATLNLQLNSELNALARAGSPPAAASEVVSVTTLDACQQRHGWRELDFVKIDAEGEELAILRGGARFFATLSPLVQYEVKEGSDWHFELVRQFAQIGYASYRLVPGLGLLVPFDTSRPHDPYLLNLYACKTDRAARLAAEGRLVTGTDPLAAAALDDAAAGQQAAAAIGRLPYGQALQAGWHGHADAGLERALALHACSQDPSRPAALRHAALAESLVLLRQPEGPPRRAVRWASIARASAELGERANAVAALRQLLAAMPTLQAADLAEPFLAPAQRFDLVPPAGFAGRWLMAATLEVLERLESFSSFYSGDGSRARLEMIETLGYGSAEMARRRRLVRARFGAQARPV